MVIGQHICTSAVSLPLQQSPIVCLFVCLFWASSDSSAPGARRFQGLLVPPLVEPLHVAVAAQDTIAGLQLATQQGQEVTGKVASPMVNLTHDDVSASCGGGGTTTQQ